MTAGIDPRLKYWRSAKGQYHLPAIMPQQIPAMDTVIDLPLSWVSYMISQ